MKSYRKGLTIFALIFMVIYFSHRISYAWLADPNFCKSCHEIEPYYVSWEESPHKDIDCRSCHETRGPFHRLDFAVRGLRDIRIHFKEEFSFPMKAVYYDSNCINCHTGDFKPDSKASAMPENHAKLIKNGRGCNNCHRDTGHKNGLGVDDKFE